MVNQGLHGGLSPAPTGDHRGAVWSGHQSMGSYVGAGASSSTRMRGCVPPSGMGRQAGGIKEKQRGTVLRRIPGRDFSRVLPYVRT